MKKLSFVVDCDYLFLKSNKICDTFFQSGNMREYTNYINYLLSNKI